MPFSARSCSNLVFSPKTTLKYLFNSALADITLLETLVEFSDWISSLTEEIILKAFIFSGLLERFRLFSIVTNKFSASTASSALTLAKILSRPDIRLPNFCISPFTESSWCKTCLICLGRSFSDRYSFTKSLSSVSTNMWLSSVHLPANFLSAWSISSGISFLRNSLPEISCESSKNAVSVRYINLPEPLRMPAWENIHLVRDSL